jgi:hypothetical protein
MVNSVENKNLLDIFEIIATILGNLGIFAITAYGFWLTYFSKNIKITSIGENHSKFLGSHIDCTILNKTLSPLIINEIKAVYNNTYEISIKKYEKEPLIVEAFKSYNVCGDEYTKLREEIKTYGDVYFKIITPENILFVKYKGRIKKRKKLITVTSFSRRFDGVVLSEQIKYILIYWHKEQKELNKIYITDCGFMDKDLMDKGGKYFNAIPKGIIEYPDKMVELFKEIFKESWNFQLNEIDD